nr:TetR family transcriptional regulator [Nocardia bovistercoris]
MRLSLELFAERGFHAVSVRELAEGVGLTKTAVLYHFPSKAEILAALVEPLLEQTEAVLAAAHAVTDPQARRWAVVHGLLDTWLEHSALLRIQMHDQALSAADDTYRRLRDIALSAQRALVGPAADLVDEVRAAQIYAALSDPVVLFADRPVDQLRAAILEGVRPLLDSTLAPVDAERSARASGRGRPGVMDARMVESAERMRDTEGRGVEEIAARLGVSRATVYRHLRRSPAASSHKYNNETDR